MPEGRKLRAFTAVERELRTPSPPHPPSTVTYPAIDFPELIEEEKLPCYHSKDFYPARVWQVLNSRYQVVGKLGYGAYSTVWLCRDLVGHCYVAVKIFSQYSTEPIQRETGAFEYLNKLATSASFGRKFIRTPLGHFELPADPAGSSKPFQCLVFEPAAASIWEMRQRVLGKRLPENVVKAVVRHVLYGLVYLHQEVKMVYADLQEKNILLSLDDFEALQAFEDAERADPLPYKVVGDRNIYLSRAMKCRTHGRPVLSDFGEARFGRTKYTGNIQPAPYRAPEVILGMPWDETVDIWSLGTMIWDMSQGAHLFETAGEPDSGQHIAQMVSLLGLPPVGFLQRSGTGESWKYFRHWTGAAALPDISLELLENSLEGENKAQFLDFVRRMLKWDPEERHTAHELLQDPWLKRH
ncbi:hypothetical protein ONZ51_g10998 [Trametes cubensis]|uniref:Protein kinase domain-containing protein n=1 Tax=Trametes cubensis TaxID=1111947 RepID=A0AAD7TK12_9APHY|nr:hypothetical protein ONZ51_g10998 [Trametes cubensis]